MNGIEFRVHKFASMNPRIHDCGTCPLSGNCNRLSCRHLPDVPTSRRSPLKICRRCGNTYIRYYNGTNGFPHVCPGCFGGKNNSTKVVYSIVF